MSETPIRAIFSLAATLVLVPAASATADDPEPTDGAARGRQGVEQVIVSDHSLQVTITDLPLEEPPIRPAPGTTVTLRSARSTTVYYGVTAACTSSLTTYTPVFTPQAKVVEASGKFSRSKGCSGREKITVHADKRKAIGWGSQKSGSGYASPGSTKQVTVKVNCTNTKSTTWRSFAVLGDDGSRQNSQSATFKCGT